MLKSIWKVWNKMEEKHKAHFQYLDRDWFEQFKELTKTYSANNDVDPSAFYFDQNKNLVFKYQEKEIDSFSQHVKKGKRRFKHLKESVKAKEKVSFIRNYYVDRINEALYKLEIGRIKVSKSESVEENNKKLFELHNKLFPLPPHEYTKAFINEFIEFICFIKKREIFDINSLSFIDELIDRDFYSIEKLHLDDEFSHIADSHIKLNENPEWKGSSDYGPKDIRRILKSFLKCIEVSKYKVALKDKSLFSVAPSKRIISVPQKKKLTKKRLNQIIFHEVCVHVYRSYKGSTNTNNKNQRLKLLSVGRNRDLFIEEGIASYFEQNAFFDSAKHDVISLMEFYIRAILVHLALNFEPFEVYEKLGKITLVLAQINGRDQKFADRKRDTLFKRLYRDYRHPQKGAANTKIAQYLYGNRVIWEFIENGGNINNLFAGKVSINDITHTKNLGFEIPEEIFGQAEFPRNYLHEKIQSCI